MLANSIPDAGEKSKAGEGDYRGWDGWMASPTQWTWVWASSGSWWWTGKPGMLQSMGSQRVRHNWATELNWTQYLWVISIKSASYSQAIHDRGAHLEPHRIFSSIQDIFGWKQGHGGRGGMGPAICWTEARNVAKYSPMYRATLHNKDLLNAKLPRKPDR